jgi:hypothetical protein
MVTIPLRGTLYATYVAIKGFTPRGDRLIIRNSVWPVDPIDRTVLCNLEI